MIRQSINQSNLKTLKFKVKLYHNTLWVNRVPKKSLKNYLKFLYGILKKKEGKQRFLEQFNYLFDDECDLNKIVCRLHLNDIRWKVWNYQEIVPARFNGQTVCVCQTDVCFGDLYFAGHTEPEILLRHVTVFFQRLFDRVICIRLIIAVVSYSLGRTYASHCPLT